MNIIRIRFKKGGAIIALSALVTLGISCSSDRAGSIKKGAFVAEYTGKHIIIAEADTLYEDSPRTYLFGLTNGSHVIDGDGIAAFINHSCDPNCEVDEIKGKVIITAIRNIKPGTELTYDYNLYDGDLDDDSPCFCGMKKCRKSMYSKKELARRKKLLAASR